MMTSANPACHPWPIEYPESDGKPMAETDVHRREIVNAIATLQEHFELDDDVYIAGDLLLYYKEGDPTACVAPDFFFVRGVPKGERRIFKVWEEKVAPQLVIEFSSRSTRLEDRGNKRELYFQLGVREYFLVDPLGEYLRPPLIGYRRGEQEFLPMVPDKDRALFSQVLNLLLVREGDRLRFVEPETRKVLLTPAELAKAEAARAERAEKEAKRAEKEAEREAARSEREAARAEQEAARADSAEKEVARMAARAESAEKEMERLRRLIEEMTAGAEKHS